MALSFAALRHCVPNALQCQQTAAQQTARPRAPCRILRTVSNRSTACSSTSALHAAPYPSRPAPGSRRQNRLAATFRPAATPPAPQEKPLTLGERLSVSYLVVAFLWLVLACSQLLAFPAPITTVPVYLWRFLGCASLLCVSVAYSLSVAAAGRGSDTYKRLSLGAFARRTAVTRACANEAGELNRPCALLRLLRSGAPLSTGASRAPSILAPAPAAFSTRLLLAARLFCCAHMYCLLCGILH